MAKKEVVTLQPDLGAVNDFNRLAPSYGNSLMVSFDVKNEKEADIHYEKRESVFADETDRDYNFAGLMFSREHGMFYFYPDTVQVFIPLLDAKKYFAKLVQDTLHVKVDVPTEALDGLFQHLKLLGKVEPKEKPEDLLSTVISYYSDGAKQRSIIGRLLYNEYAEGKEVKVSRDDYNVFMKKFTGDIITLAEAFNKVMASAKKRTSDGLLNTNLNVQQAISGSFKESSFLNLKSVIEGDGTANGVKVLSANFFFNSVVRDFYDRLFYKNGKQKAETSPVRDQLDTVITGINAADLMTHPASGIITALGQFASPPAKAEDSEYDTDYILPDVTTAHDMLMNGKEVNRVLKAYSGNADVNTVLDNIEDKNQPLENPSAYVMTDRIVRAMTDLLKMMTNQKVTDNTRYTK